MQAKNIVSINFLTLKGTFLMTAIAQQQFDCSCLNLMKKQLTYIVTYIKNYRKFVPIDIIQGKN